MRKSKDPFEEEIKEGRDCMEKERREMEEARRREEAEWHEREEDPAGYALRREMLKRAQEYAKGRGWVLPASVTISHQGSALGNKRDGTETIINHNYEVTAYHDDGDEMFKFRTVVWLDDVDLC